MKSIHAKIGVDSFEKLISISKISYHGYGQNPTLSGEVVDSIISYCIEKTYNDIYSKLDTHEAPLPLTPPETSKSQKLYNLYQTVKSLRKAGKTDTHIVSYMNRNKEPTPDNVFSIRPLKQIKLTPARWVIEDVRFLMNIDAVNEFLVELNKRTQRISTNTSTAEKP